MESLIDLPASITKFNARGTISVFPAVRVGRPRQQGCINMGSEDGHAPRLGSRDAPRGSFSVVVQCRTGQNRFTAEALDLSQTGIRIRTLNPLRVGTSQWVKVDGLEALETSVVWTSGFISGCRFVQPLHQAVYDRLLKGVPPAPEG